MWLLSKKVYGKYFKYNTYCALYLRRYKDAKKFSQVKKGNFLNSVVAVSTTARQVR
jgi:hypothetical protein